MNTPLNQFDLFGSIMGKSFQVFVDNVMATRYNVPQWKKYYSWDPIISISDTFDALESTMDVFPMVSVISNDAPKPKRALQGISLYSGKIPKMGHEYDITEQQLRQIYAIMNAGGSVASDQLRELLFNTVNKAEFGVHARLNSMGFMAMSTGHIVLDTTNNPDGGYIVDLDMRVPTANKKYAGFGNGTNVAWTDPTATPLTDLQDLVKYADDNFIGYDVLRFHKSLWRSFTTHPNVIKDVRAFFANTNLTGGIIGETQLKTYMSELGLPMVEIIDELSGVEADGVVTGVSSFDASNVVLTTKAPIGQIKSAQPIYFEGDGTVRKAATEGGRIQLLQSFNMKKRIQTVEVECLALPVISRPKGLIILDTSKTTQWT